MSKNPAFQFYPGDWTRDLDDQPLEVEGAWIRICCRLWWSETKGQATKPIREWARILRKSEKKTKEILEILLSKSISSGSVLDNQNVTIISRRMVRDYEISQIRRTVGKLGGNPGLTKVKEILVNQNLSKTASLLSSVSSSDKEEVLPEAKISFIHKEKKFSGIVKSHFELWEPAFPAVNIDMELAKMEVWLLANPKNRKSNYERFISNWLTRAQDKAVRS
jgi:hypothetical protein